MYVGSAPEHAQLHSSSTGKGGAAVSASKEPAGNVVSAEAAPFISPVVNFNYQAGLAVVEFRDGQTGEVRDQYPSKKAVEEYIRHGASSQESSASTSPPDPGPAPQATGTDPAVTAAIGAAPPAAPVSAPAPAPAPTPAPAPAASPVVHSA
ncbi:hypothetical protein [Paramagnetospirillum kuznetsovii]|uniref:hypothetical protein n=1 Tax=Paramagnetospirillum kuznetsovii TaxID=2053833 RepID=UPI0011BEE6D2|nr:hypothetical protein [Paramagnetospirillum kuznetsovii]